jgi:YidC/Oxa1 family membrane protein insertase
MFEGFFDALASVLNFFFTLVPEGLRGSLGFGLAIMGLTVLVMTLITPLTVKSTRSMMQMQRLQPEMKRLQEKHKDDREKLNQELMAFYRENQINPLGGCLPLIAQMPVFIIMYQLLRGLTVRPGGMGSGAGQVIAQVQQSVQTTPWLYTDQNFTPDHLNQGSELYEALSVTNDMNFLGMDLSLSAAQAVGKSLVVAIPYFVLLLIMLGTGLYQNRQMQARNTSGSVNPQQQMLMRFMPFFLPVFSYGFPAGLALYWCTQNFCRIGTNAYITRSLYKKEHAEDQAIEASATERTSKKKAVESGSSSSGKGAGSNGSTDKRSKRKDDGDAVPAKAKKTRPSGPGKSAKSQAAHRKTSGGSSSTGSSSSSNGRKVNSRRSGQSRRGPSSTSDK